MHGLTNAVLNFLIIAAGILSFSAMPACQLFKKQKKNNRGNSFVEEASVKFVRHADKHTESTLTFALRSNGGCQIKVFPQEKDEMQAVKEADAKACPGNGNRNSFTEEFANLRTDTLYAAEILAWPEGKTIEDAERFVAFEQTANGLGERFITLNANLKQQVMQVRSVRPNGALTLAAAYRSYKPLEGCVLNREYPPLPENSPFSLDAEASKHVKVSGQIVAETLEGQQPSLLPFNGLFDEDTLHARISFGSGKASLETTAVGRLHALKVESPQEIELPLSRYTHSNINVPVKSGESLRLSWQASQLSEQTFVKVSIEPSPGSIEGFTCFLEAKGGSAVIPFEPFLKGLRSGSYQVFVSFVYRSVALFTSPNVWFLTAHDWRSFRLERI